MAKKNYKNYSVEIHKRGDKSIKRTILLVASSKSDAEKQGRKAYTDAVVNYVKPLDDIYSKQPKRIKNGKEEYV